MKVLVIGAGGREHAIVWKLHKDGHHVTCVPGNAGIAQLADCVDLSIEPKALANFAKEQGIELTIVGPEAPLEQGLADHFTEQGLAVFGPKKAAAQLESSKAFSKAFMSKHGIPTAEYYTCHSIEAARDCAAKFCEEGEGVVIKPSGLTAGKGVTVCKTLEEANAALDEIGAYGSASAQIVVEERLKGIECSVQCFCDGKRMVMMPPAQDHKRLLNNDQGPNTGGMGAFAPTPFLTERMRSVVEQEVVQRSLQGIQDDGLDFCGVLYCGLMLTEDGPRVLEYNCRFGDPEAQAVLSLLESDLAETCLACAQGDMEEAMPEWSSGAACVVVMASNGYPRSHDTGFPIEGLTAANRKARTVVFHAGTKQANNATVTAGGRVLGVTGTGNSLSEAIETAYAGCSEVRFEGAHYRKDIGKRAKQLLAQS